MLEKTSYQKRPKIVSNMTNFLSWTIKIALLMAFTQCTIPKKVSNNLETYNPDTDDKEYFDDRISLRWDDDLTCWSEFFESVRISENTNYEYDLDIPIINDRVVAFSFTSHNIPDKLTIVWTKINWQIDTVATTLFISAQWQPLWTWTWLSTENTISWPLLVCAHPDNPWSIALPLWSIPNSFSTSPQSVALLVLAMNEQYTSYKVIATWSPTNTVFWAKIFCIDKEKIEITWNDVICWNPRSTLSLNFNTELPLPASLTTEIYDIQRFSPSWELIGTVSSINFVPTESWTYTVIATPFCDQLQAFELSKEIYVNTDIELSTDTREITECNFDEQYVIWLEIEWWTPPYELSIPLNTYEQNFMFEWDNIFIQWDELPQTISITAIDSVWCRANILIPVSWCCDMLIKEEVWFFPNIFSPNNDWNNDYWRPFLKAWYILDEIQIYDRRGNYIYSNKEMWDQLWWDGRFHSRDVEQWVYVYMIKVLCPNWITTIFPWDVTVLR